MTVDEAIAKLERYGQVRIEDPDGEGHYTVCKAGDHIYGMPSLYWKGKELPDIYVHEMTELGRLIPWVANYNGNRFAMKYYVSGEADPSVLARIVIGVILSGRRLKHMTCGQTISSLNSYP